MELLLKLWSLVKAVVGALLGTHHPQAGNYFIGGDEMGLKEGKHLAVTFTLWDAASRGGDGLLLRSSSARLVHHLANYFTGPHLRALPAEGVKIAPPPFPALTPQTLAVVFTKMARGLRR